MLLLLFTGWSYNNNVLDWTRWRVHRLLWPKQEGSRNSWFNRCTHEITHEEEVARVVSPDIGLSCWRGRRLCLPKEPLYNVMYSIAFIPWDHHSTWDVALGSANPVCHIATTMGPEGQGKQSWWRTGLSEPSEGGIWAPFHRNGTWSSTNSWTVSGTLLRQIVGPDSTAECHFHSALAFSTCVLVCW